VKLRLALAALCAALLIAPWSLDQARAAPCLLCGENSASMAPSAATSDELPLRITISAQLDFSRVATGQGGGSVTLDPVTGQRRVSGGLQDIGGLALTGEAMVSGTPGRAVRVILPGEILLDSDQGRSARVVDLTTNLGPAPRLGPDGRLNFRFGGRLAVGRDDDGNYRGRIPISVEYE
jgi:Domain of unknown function (DUF4402)